jgi:hypothetical protein
MLTSSEHSIQSMALETKVERQHGETLRLIDMPAVLDGSDHIFDRLPGDVQIEDSTVWRDEMFTGVVADCAANHGAALIAYLKKIVTADFDVREMVRDATEEFAQHVVDPYDDVVARDVGRKFGIVYAGGMLGIRFGIVPWNSDELLDAIAKCYQGARNLLPDEGVALRRGVATLQARLRRLDSRKALLEPGSSTKWDKIEGYRQLLPDQRRYIIRRDVFNTLFATTTQRNLVLKWLIDNNRITMALVKTAGPKVSRNPKEQFIWPDNKRRRSYKIVFPRT